MLDYIANVYYGEEFICSIGAKHAAYDNVIWWQLEEVINAFRGKRITRDMLNEEIKNHAAYFKGVLENRKPMKDADKIDFLNETITNPHVSCNIAYVYEMKDVTKEEVGFELVKKDGKYYSRYEETDDYEMPHIEYDVSLLEKKSYTFDEYLKVANFVNGLLDTNEIDFILNNNLVLKLYVI